MILRILEGLFGLVLIGYGINGFLNPIEMVWGPTKEAWDKHGYTVRKFHYFVVKCVKVPGVIILGSLLLWHAIMPDHSFFEVSSDPVEQTQTDQSQKPSGD